MENNGLKLTTDYSLEKMIGLFIYIAIMPKPLVIYYQVTEPKLNFLYHYFLHFTFMIQTLNLKLQ